MKIFPSNLLYNLDIQAQKLSILSSILSGVLFRKYLWPVQTAGKSCSESEDFFTELTTQECKYTCKSDKARFLCQIKCVKKDGCVGINYSEKVFKYRYYCGICTSNKLQSSKHGFEFYQKPTGNYKNFQCISTISY